MVNLWEMQFACKQFDIEFFFTLQTFMIQDFQELMTFMKNM